MTLMRMALRSLSGSMILGVLWAAPARALTATVPEPMASQVDMPANFEVVVADAVGPARVRWNLGDGTITDFVEGATEYVHTYAAAGHYPVLVTVEDDASFTGLSFVHSVHLPLTPGRAAGSSDLVYDPASRKLYAANYDNDSVSVVDADGMTKLAEIPVSRGPISLGLSPAGKLWVLHRDAHSLSIVDTESLSVETELRLPYASQPMGLAISPTGDAAYVSLMALGRLLKLDPATGATLAETDVGGSPRGVSVSHDGALVYVTRFISEDSHGEVVRLAAATFEIETRFELAADTTTQDTDQQGRGLPNYLFSIGLSPDGRFAWVPGKKDNIFRGPFRDQLALTDDNTVRPLIALLDVAAGGEDIARRIDLDDRNLPNQVVFTPIGDYAFVSLAGSASIEVRSGYTGGFVTAFKEAGFAPRGLVLTEDDKLFVHASLSRSLIVYDVADVVSSRAQTAARLAEIPTVDSEKLDVQVLRGKQLFFNSSDIRMSDQGYMSCASCHFDGAEDGRVWDFGSAGEGLRNSVSLLGRRGTGHGNVNWSGSFDEIQDVDDNIRNLFGGRGFLSAEQVAAGSVATPLGDPKAGLDPDLDALAAFVSSLDVYRKSPYRNPDGTLTADGAAGRVIFKRLGCGFCHAGADASDSARGKLHDVGTLEPSSGQRGGEPLYGIDTPTLHGVWETPPYLHDGSAATLRDVLTSANPEDLHGFVSELSDPELDQLVAYVRQLDGTPDPDDESSLGGSAGTGGSEPAGITPSGGCTMAARCATSEAWLWAALLLGSALAWRSSRIRKVAWLGSLLLVTNACSSGEGDAESDWAELPPLVERDPELADLPVRDQQYDKLCALARDDSFFRAVCATPRPVISDMASLIRVAGLEENRAFALTGNSTSLVVRAVSAINPRAILFPRVSEKLERPSELTALAFVRGEPFVEVVSRDTGSGEYNFYLFTFERECDYAASCDLASLLSEEIEHGWTAYSIYTEEDLENTSLDCRSCHQPGGYGTAKILRMQELESPWLHWFPQRFVQRTASDRLLTAQFLEAHAIDSAYAGIPIATIRNAIDEGSGAQLEALLVAEGQDAQPNAFDPRIEAEAKDGAPSPTWEQQFAVSLAGDAIGVPYPQADVSDPELYAARVQSYIDVVSGAAPRESLLDLRDIFSADARQKLGLVPPPGADGRTVLTQACARCHDGRSNPELTKSSFNVKALELMSREEKNKAIGRLQQPEGSLQRMPPWRAAALPEAELESAVAELAK